MSDVPAAPQPAVELVRQLILTQAPQWAEEPISPSLTTGSTNWMFRLGQHHAVRLPRTDSGAADLRTEATWLPQIAAQVSFPVPTIHQVGQPSALFGRAWSIVDWLPGEHPADLNANQQHQLATSLGAFVRELHAIDPGDIDVGPPRWGYRTGEPVTQTSDAWVSQAAESLTDLFDPRQIARAWKLIRAVPPPSMPPCWVHTDLSAENLLINADQQRHDSGAVRGVIDFGGLGVGDRAVDLLYAWSMLDKPARDVFATSSAVDEGTWLRARAWAFAGPGLLTLANYRDTMPVRTARLIQMVQAAADEVGITIAH